jgi:3-mercaptopyruvate sulfurtransferase SseA
MTAKNNSEWGCKNPDVLVSTEWIAAYLNDAGIQIIKPNEDTLLYPSGHIPGAVRVDWKSDLNDQVYRDYIYCSGFDALMSQIGMTSEKITVFCRDKRKNYGMVAGYFMPVTRQRCYIKNLLFSSGRRTIHRKSAHRVQ